MASANKPLIAVVGATGAQGGSVVQYLLNDPDHSFRVRGLTRNVDSPKAKALTERGVEVVKANMDDVNSLKKAFEGAFGVFGVTNFWEVFSGEKETQHGKALVNAAVAVGVKHFVWSAMDHTSDPTVPHWDSKAEVDDYLKKTKLPRTSLYTSAYYENFLAFPNLIIKKDDAGKLVADWPVFWTDGPIGGYSVAETGAYVLEAFKKPKEWIGKDLRVLSDVFTPRQFVKALSDITGKEIVIREYNREKFNESRASENFYKYNGNPNRDPELTLRINPSRKDYGTFIQANKEAFLASFSS
ncbi:NmrA-domain-containing protein [Fomitiporia mediterranea MF3/22]|uniref:NmrA-domain-containing protein n=1 Tax=Fomitiporia mediterranea (strain MF3/22) TaxID=694068 RepID=UPI00044099E3|nr:NmrA-domain-containing protein [Fomitiporia mediterranea MF3/22]EJD00673.1 NmrA-domain-containing protein [Fomitiporia mediterranea MF3/22]